MFLLSPNLLDPRTNYRGLCQLSVFRDNCSLGLPGLFVCFFYCMKVDNCKIYKVREADFFRRFIFAPKWAKWAQNDPKSRFFSEKICKNFVNLKKLLFCEFGAMGKFWFSSYAY